MKTLTHLTIFLLICLSCSSINAQSGNIVVFSPTGNHFYLTVDNHLQNPKPQKNVKVTGMPEGNSFIKVEFWNKEMASLKQSLRIDANKETSYILKKEGGQLVLEEYSSVPLNQVGSSDNKQFVTNYSRTGVAKIEVDKVEDEPNVFTERSIVSSDPANSNTNGVYTGGNLADKREGSFKISEKTTDNPGNTSKKSNVPDPADYPQITETIEYKTETTTGGNMQIVEVRTTNTKDLVEVNGQKYIKSKNEMRETVTPYQCVPMDGEKFKQALNHARVAAASPLYNCVKSFSGACLTAEQANEIKELIPASWTKFIEDATPKCADPNNCPFKEEPAIVEVIKEEPKVEPIVEPEVVVVEEPKVEPKPKTAKELKAELKAAKKREKAAAKAAKKAAKEAAKKK